MVLWLCGACQASQLNAAVHPSLATKHRRPRIRSRLASLSFPERRIGRPFPAVIVPQGAQWATLNFIEIAASAACSALSVGIISYLGYFLFKGTGSASLGLSPTSWLGNRQLIAQAALRKHQAAKGPAGSAAGIAGVYSGVTTAWHIVDVRSDKMDFVTFACLCSYIAIGDFMRGRGLTGVAQATLVAGLIKLFTSSKSGRNFDFVDVPLASPQSRVRGRRRFGMVA